MLINDMGMLKRCGYLFEAWNPQCYWFPMVVVLRSLVLGVVPMVLSDAQVLAIIIMSAAIILSIILLTWHKPRRTAALNLTDVIYSFVQLIVLTAGATTITGTPLATEYSGFLLFAIIVSLVCGASVA